MVPTFKLYRTPTIMSGLVYRWKLDDDRWDAEISASRDGVLISGHWPLIVNDPDRVDVEKVLTAACDVFRRMAEYARRFPLHGPGFDYVPAGWTITPSPPFGGSHAR